MGPLAPAARVWMQLFWFREPAITTANFHQVSFRALRNRRGISFPLGCAVYELVSGRVRRGSFSALPLGAQTIDVITFLTGTTVGGIVVAAINNTFGWFLPFRQATAKTKADQQKAEQDVEDALAVLWSGESALRGVRTAVGLLTKAHNEGRYYTYSRRAEFYNISYQLHAPVGWALIRAREHQGKIHSLVARNRKLKVLWRLVEALTIVLQDDQELAQCEPAIVGYKVGTQALNVDLLLSAMWIPPGDGGNAVSIARRGKLFFPATHDELRDELDSARYVLENFNPDRSRVFWRALLALYLICDLIDVARSGAELDVDAWPFSEADRQRLQVGPYFFGVEHPDLEVARRYVKARFL